MIAKVAFKMFLGISADITSWNADSTAFSLLLYENPLSGAWFAKGFLKALLTPQSSAECVELPPQHSQLLYSNVLCGVIRGALEMVRKRARARDLQAISFAYARARARTGPIAGGVPVRARRTPGRRCQRDPVRACSFACGCKTSNARAALAIAPRAASSSRRSSKTKCPANMRSRNRPGSLGQDCTEPAWVSGSDRNSCDGPARGRRRGRRCDIERSRGSSHIVRAKLSTQN